MTGRGILSKFLGGILGLFVAASVAGASVAGAHPLSGSDLTLSQGKGELRLVIHLPLQELAVAFPALKLSEAATHRQALSATDLALLEAYFAVHVQLQKAGADLRLRFEGAALMAGQSPDPGASEMLVVDLVAPMPDRAAVFPLVLRYDAVMHERRDHQAVVSWLVDGAGPVELARFGQGSVDGIQVAVVLQAPAPGP